MNTEKLYALIENAKTSDQRLIALAACFLTGKVPGNFTFDLTDWGNGDSLAVRDRQPHKINDFKHRCGTTGCVAGFANYLFGGTYRISDSTNAARLLGLYEDCVPPNDLFIPQMPDEGYAEVSRNPVMAGRVLVHLIRTGKADWSVRNTPVTVGGKTF